eukprot:gene7157-7225_t
MILTARVTAAVPANYRYDSRPLRDTIIQLDTNKNQKPIKGKKSKAKVTSHAEDSTYVDQVHEITYLYGKARVTYGDFELDADYIRVDKKNHLLFAKGSIDPITKRYKGKLWNPASNQDGNYISGGQTKKLNETEVAYRNVIFSTCDLPYPDTHFGIVITKGIAEKNRIISGPAYLEIEGIPLPLAIPFGFFPKPDTRSSGVIIPTFGEDQKLGFYLRNFGYYIGISDYMDLTNMGTIYSKGSYELNTTLHYLKRYKYGGTLSFAYGSHNYGLQGDPPTKDFNVTWSHSQDPNANPGSTLSASVNAGTSTFYANNPSYSNYNLQALTQNNLRSTVNYSKTWAGTPFNLSVGLSHSQDLTNKTVTLDLPTLSFTMASLSPFDSKDRIGDQKWYQRLTVSYSLQANNQLNAIPEAELFKANTLIKNLQTSIVHQIPVSLSLNVFKYFQFSSSSDTTVIDTVNGFRRAGTYSLSTGISTKVYGTINFKKGNLKAIRDVITPSLSFSYNPDFSDPSYGYYKTVVSNATAGIGLNIDNTIQMKLKAKATDTSGKDRKVSLLDGFSVSTFYNFAQDSLRLSPISFSAHTGILNNKVNFSFFGSLNPYVTQVLDSISGGQIQRFTRPINRYTFQDGRFPTLTSFSFSVSGSLNSNSFSPHAPVQPGGTLQTINPQQAQRLAVINSDPSAYIDFNVPWNVSVNYSFSYNNNIINTSSSNTVMLSGDVNLTSKWKIQYNTNYDIRARRLAVSQFTIYRDLHCWDLNVSWVPFGLYKSYNVTLKVKATILQDLKISKRSDYTSNQSQIVDTNSAWMAHELNKIGIRIKQISSVSDDRQHILKALGEAKERADIILITGGLGPTKDDITKKTIADYFGVKLIENKDALENVTNIFARYNRPLLEVNKMQALVPENCEVLLNKNGTAPGMWFKVDGKIYISMPGVPHEMMYMMEDATGEAEEVTEDTAPLSAPVKEHSSPVIAETPKVTEAIPPASVQIAEPIPTEPVKVPEPVVETSAAEHEAIEVSKQPVFNEPRAENIPPVPFTEQLEQKQHIGQGDAPSESFRFYSPLVKNIAAQEGLSAAELDKIPGTGAEGRLTKDDLLLYIQNRYKQQPVTNEPVSPPVQAEKEQPVASKIPVAAQAEHVPASAEQVPPVVEVTVPVAEKPVEQAVTDTPVPEPAVESPQPTPTPVAEAPKTAPAPEPAKVVSEPAIKSTGSMSGGDEIIEMDRMRRLIADHMVMSKHTSPHVTSFVEADVTNIVLWREKIKNSFEKREGEKITYTPIFIEAVVRAIKDLPMINISVNGTQIIKKKDINISMATALPNGNLIVPVIKKADELSLLGLTKSSRFKRRDFFSLNRLQINLSGQSGLCKFSRNGFIDDL